MLPLTGQTLVTWLSLSAREVGKCSFLAGPNAAQDKIGILLLMKEGKWMLGIQLVVSAIDSPMGERVNLIS